MGLSLLDIVHIQFPSIESVLGGGVGVNREGGYVEALLLGASASLVSSPCSSPVLAALLAFIASAAAEGSAQAAAGALLLLVFSLGYATPVVAAGLLSSELASAGPLRGLQWGGGCLGALLVAYGTYSSLASLQDLLS